MNSSPFRPGARRKWLWIALVVGNLAIGLVLAWFLLHPDLFQGKARPVSDTSMVGASGPTTGQPAPDFTLKTLDGDEVTLSALRGHPVLINFWASWCQPCRREMPELVRVYAAHRLDGLAILGVNLTYQDTLPDIRAFVKEFDVPYPILLDDTGRVAEDLYRLPGVPMSVFVERSGVISRIYLGAMSGEQVDGYTGEILK